MNDFFVALEKDPYKAHKEIIANGGYPALRDWVRGIAVDHGLTLTVLPTFDRDIQRWKDIARILGGKLCEGGDGITITREQLTKGLWEMISHFRSAHKFHRNGETYIRGGCIVRSDKLTDVERGVYVKLVRAYNNEMKKRGHKFISLSDWMKEQRLPMARCRSPRLPSLGRSGTRA